MRLSQIAAVAIRIFAINFALSVVPYAFEIFTAWYSGTIPFPLLAMQAAFAAGTVALWFGAPFSARVVTREQDATLDSPGISLSDLYRFAFLIVGLYYTIQSIGPAMSWLYFAFVQSQARTFSPQQPATFTFYQLTEILTRLAAGLTLTLNSRKLALKLIKLQGGVTLP